MPTISFSRQQFLTHLVKPVAQVMGLTVPSGVSPYDVFAAAVLAAPEPDGVDFDAIEISLPDFMLPTPGDTAGTPPAAAPAVEPEAVLEAIAKALKNAEGLLNDANLALLSGSVGIKLNVAVAGVAGAQTEFTLQIGPVPQS